MSTPSARLVASLAALSVIVILAGRADRALALSFSGDATASGIGGPTNSTTLPSAESTTGLISSVGGCNTARAQSWLSASGGALALSSFATGSPAPGVCVASCDGHSNAAISDQFMVQSDVLAPGTLVNVSLCVKSAIRHGSSFTCANVINDGAGGTASVNVSFTYSGQSLSAPGTYSERWNCFDGHDLNVTGICVPGAGSQTLTLTNVPVGGTVSFFSTMSISSTVTSFDNGVENHIELAVVYGYSSPSPVRLVSIDTGHEMSPASNCTDVNLGVWLPPNGGVLGVSDAPRSRGVELMTPAPNPSSGRVSVAFQLPRAQSVELAVYDLAGARVARLSRGWTTEGAHTVAWNGRDDRGGQVRQGFYWVRLVTPDGNVTRMLARLR
jgi:hypothetical protein